MTWAQRAKLGSEARSCKTIFNTQVNPHFKRESGMIMVEGPEMSHQPAGGKSQVPQRFQHVFDDTLKRGPAAMVANAHGGAETQSIRKSLDD